MVFPLVGQSYKHCQMGAFVLDVDDADDDDSGGWKDQMCIFLMDFPVSNKYRGRVVVVVDVSSVGRVRTQVQAPNPRNLASE